VFNPETGRHAYGNILKGDVKIILIDSVGIELEQ